MWISDRRWNGRAISRRYETTDDPYRPRNHDVFNLIGALAYREPSQDQGVKMPKTLCHAGITA
jgi:hypothetical protein